ncbi:putative GPI-anchored protein pfl2 isoform X2 [Polyodon spathula]|uniref:putative GPI-anchored protein pfl2 isoform X2 n=1 Tax=Polyodon spathula TaxID=7913 RepID=UPI001B7D9638|nr:putative GPI-anchored protein pfl2 isoform X2 [Polyodon spathula]
MRMSRTTILFYCIGLWISVALSNSVPEDLDGSGGDDQDFSGSGDGDSSPTTTAMASLDVTMSPSSSSATEQASAIVEKGITSPVRTTTSPEMTEKTTLEKQKTTEGAVHIPVADRTTSRPVSTAEKSPDTTTAAVALHGVVSNKELSSTAVNPTRSSVPLSTSASIVYSNAKHGSTADSTTSVGITQSSSASVHIVHLDANPKYTAGPTTTVGTAPASATSASAGIADSDAKPESTEDSTTPASITESSSSSTSASVHIVHLDAKPKYTAGPTTTVGTAPASATSASAGIVDSDAKPDGTVASNITDDIAGPNKGRKLSPGPLPGDREDLAAETNLDDLYLEDATVSQTNNKVQGEVPQIYQPNNIQEASKEGDNSMSQGLMERKEVLGGKNLVYTFFFYIF